MNMSTLTSKPKRFRSQRPRGAALVELAICLPILVTLFLGAIEISNFIYLRQALASAAYEAARVAIQNGATAQAPIDKANKVLAARKLKGATVTVSPAVTSPRGTRLTITVSAPSSANRLVLPRYVGKLKVKVQASMVKE